MYDKTNVLLWTKVWDEFYVMKMKIKIVHINTT